MKVVGVKEVENSQGGELRLESGDIVTPLARDRAIELNVRFSTVPRPSPDRDCFGSGTPAAAFAANDERRRALNELPENSEDPPAGALYRRGAPVVQGRHRPESLSDGSATRVDSGRAQHGTDRVTVVGAGHVGVTTAMRLAESDLFGEVVMVDVVPGLAAGLALDLWHSSGLRRFATSIRGTSDPAEAADSDYAIVTAGRPRQPGMSRSDLTMVNAKIIRGVCHDIARYSPNAIVVVVTNPLDEMTALAWRETGFPSHRVLGMAGVLDAARFCSLAALATGRRPEEISALALGSHGNEMVIPLSQARGGISPIGEFLDSATLEALVERTRNSGAEVVELIERGSAYYAPAAAVTRMVLAMVQDTREILPACVQGDGTFGISDTYVGLPARLGSGGVLEIIELDLTTSELSQLRLAAERIAERVRELADA